VARHHRHERPAWFEERGPIFQRAIDQFVAQLAGKPGISQILLIGSVARGEPRPADLDLAVIVANVEEAVPHVSLASRRLSQITHLADVFVFDTAETYVGRICERSPLNCPTRSVECIPGCGAIKCLKIVPGFLARPDIFVGARVLWPQRPETHES
jgi:predicted nucleotidyltransferase